jgi:predicted nucleic acid-binding protein
MIPLDERIVFKMLKLIEKYKLSLVDSLVLSTAIDVKADALITRDESFKKVKEMKIKIPDELL